MNMATKNNHNNYQLFCFLFLMSFFLSFFFFVKFDFYKKIHSLQLFSLAGKTLNFWQKQWLQGFFFVIDIFLLVEVRYSTIWVGNTAHSIKVYKV